MNYVFAAYTPEPCRDLHIGARDDEFRVGWRKNSAAGICKQNAGSERRVNDNVGSFDERARFFFFSLPARHIPRSNAYLVDYSRSELDFVRSVTAFSRPEESVVIGAKPELAERRRASTGVVVPRLRDRRPCLLLLAVRSLSPPLSLSLSPPSPRTRACVRRACL